ncbi:MAG TPA: hypothetical protein VGU64_09475, partial [Terriglobales bacterium]|nr:hypothetical protein [Terriglobales bacterium]
AMHYSAMNTHFAAGDPVYEQALRQLGEAYAQTGTAQPVALASSGLAQSLTQQVTLLATLDYFWIVACIGIFGAVVMLLQRALK